MDMLEELLSPGLRLAVRPKVWEGDVALRLIVGVIC